MQHAVSRIQYLDGLRGLAIILVILFHAYSRWPKKYPYGDTFAQIPVFDNGWIGVQLFFMISGFVIFMTLERCQGFFQFMAKRWVRLFPAMLVCSLLIFLSAKFFHERPLGIPPARALLPGLTFVEPYWWELILGSRQRELEGAFWSLYVEVKLYLVAGIFYFLFGWRVMVSVLIAMFLVGVAVLFMDPWFVENQWHTAKWINSSLSGRPCGWFAAGVLFYRYKATSNSNYFIMALALALASGVAAGKSAWGPMDFAWDRVIAGVTVALIFTSAIRFEKFQQAIANRFLLFIGFISYPLYLLHENMMVSLIAKLGKLELGGPLLLMPALPMVFVIFLGWLVARFIEPKARRWLKILVVERINVGSKRLKLSQS